MSHWFEPTPARCQECGEEALHGNHKKRCDGTYSGFGPGFSFCELEAEHDGPHLLNPWDGSQWLVDGATYTKTRPTRYETAQEGTDVDTA